MMNRLFNTFIELPKPNFLEKLPQAETLKKIAPELPSLFNELIGAKKEVFTNNLPLDKAKTHFFRLGVLAIETLFNKHIYKQKALVNEIEQLNGKSLTLLINEIGQEMTLVFHKTGVEILLDAEYQSDCKLITSFATLKRIKDKTLLTELIKTNQLVVDGDVRVLQQLNQLIDKLEMNIGSILSPVLGDLASSIIETTLSKLFGVINEKAQTVSSCFSTMKNNQPF